MANLLEKELATLMAKLIKDYFGKGPENTKVYITKDYLLVKCQGLLSPVEQYSLDSPGYAEEIRYHRKKLSDIFEAKVRPLIEDFMKKKFADSYVDWRPEHNSMVKVMFFETAKE